MYKNLKNSILYFYIFVFSFPGFLSAQAVSLVFRGDADLYEKDIVRATNGNTYSLCGKNISPLEESVVVMALDANHEMLWKKELSSDISLLRPGFIKVLPDGNIVVFMDDFAPGSNLGGSNITIALLNAQGETISIKRIGTVLYEEIDDMVVLPNGHWLLVGNMATDNGYGVFLTEIDNDNIISTSTFQLGLYDYLTQFYVYNQKTYLFGTTYVFPGPAQPMLLALDSTGLPEKSWVFSCPDLQGSAGTLVADETGFHVEVSYDDRAVFFRFENGELTTGAKDFGYGYISKIYENQGNTYYFNPKEYSLRKNEEKKFHVGTELAGMTKLVFSDQGWTGLGSVKENNRSVIHMASDVLEPGEACGSYPFSSLPPLVDKNVSILSPNHQVFTPPLVSYFNASDVKDQEANLTMEVTCSNVTIETTEASAWRLYPNPAHEVIYLPPGDVYEIFGIDGRRLKSGISTGVVSIDFLMPGYYLLKRGKTTQGFCKI